MPTLVALLLSAGPTPTLRFMAVPSVSPARLGEQLEVLGCDAGLCRVRALCGERAECPTELQPEEHLSVSRPTWETATQSADQALARALTLRAEAWVWVARAQLEDGLGHRAQSQKYAREALKQAPLDQGSALRLAALGTAERGGVPAVRDGERVVAICQDRVERGAVKVRERRGDNGWEFTLSGVCAKSVRGWVIAGLPSGTVPRGTFAADAGSWAFGTERFHLEHRTLGSWLVNEVTHARALMPSRTATLAFLGDLDGDGAADALLEEAGDCGPARVWLMLSTASPVPSVPVTVAGAEGLGALCE